MVKRLWRQAYFLAEIARHPIGALSDSARFLTYGMVKIFGTAGMALAFYRTAKPENKQRLKVTLILNCDLRSGGDHRTF